MAAFASGKGKSRAADSGGDGSTVSPEQRARSLLLRQLSTAPKTRWQLEQKLVDSDVPEDIADPLLSYFEEIGLIDDSAFARLWVDSRSRTKSLSRSALRRELAEKGVPAEYIEGALEQLSEEDELEHARQLIRRKMPSNFSAQDRGGRDKTVRRLVSMLGRKGYSAGLAFRLVADECEAVYEDPAESSSDWPQ